MATVSDSTLEDIKSRIDLADLISSYGIAVRHSGSSVMACCPFHNEKTPSFSINPAKGFYHCFGCGESGDAIKFVMKYEGLEFLDAVRKLAEQCGVKIEEREDPEAGLRKRLMALMAELAEFYHRCLLKMKEAQLARDYLMKRDLGPQVQEDFLIGYAPNGMSPMLKWAEKYGYTVEELEAAGVVKGPRGPGDLGYHRFGGRLMFSVKDKQGRVVAFSGRQLVENKNSGKYVNSPETPIFKKSSVLFGFDRAAKEIARAPHREAIVCEGQIDTIRLHISGFPVAVASQGTAFTETHANMLKRVADAVVLVFDDDAAGHKATIRTASMLLASEIPVRVVSLPGGDDPDSFLRTKGADAFRKLLENAESIVSFQCRVERAKEQNPKSIDAVSRISKAVLATISACPSAILRASLADEAAKLLGLPAAAVSEELEKIRATGKARPSEAPRRDGDIAPRETEPDPGMAAIPGESAAEAEPPPRRELALAAFLLANERDAALDAIIGEFLPREVFAHDFTWRFVEAWRMGIANGEDALAVFAEGLSPREREWFDELMLSAGRTNASTLAPAEIMQDYVRSLWCDALKRRRGSLPATGDPEADMERMKISADLKRLNMVKWHTVKEMVRQLLK
jgi:DNA primase